MVTLKRAALSLLISALLIGVFFFLGFTVFFDLQETIILLASLFLTVFLIIFFLFNLRQHPFAVVENRLQLLQISLTEQFYNRKNEGIGGFDRNNCSRELEQRRGEITLQLMQGIRVSDKEKRDIDALVKKSLDRLFWFIGAGSLYTSPASPQLPLTNAQSAEKPSLLMKAAAIKNNEGVIKEHEGILYINGDIINTDYESPEINLDFKDLVDSVIKTG